MNKKNAFQLSIILLISMVLTSCISELFGTRGKGSIVTESRTATDFKSIKLVGSADVEIVKGSAFKVEVSDYENIVQYLSVKVEDHELIISKDPETIVLSNSEAKVKVTMPDSLTAISLVGSGDINVNSAFKDMQMLSITGSGDININQNVNLNILSTNIIGSGNITALGKVNTLTAEISGSGDIKFSDLQAGSATCSISGSGNIDINVVTALNATISGSGNISYSGSPTVTKQITGSGSVVKKQE